MGRAMFSKSLIQFSVDGWGCVPPLLFTWGQTTYGRTNTKIDVLFIIGDWNAKVGSQEIPGVIGKFGLGVQNEAGQRLLEFCQENVLVIGNTLFQQKKRRLHMAITRWSIMKSD